MRLDVPACGLSPEDKDSCVSCLKQCHVDKAGYPLCKNGATVYCSSATCRMLVAFETVLLICVDNNGNNNNNNNKRNVDSHSSGSNDTKMVMIMLTQT